MITLATLPQATEQEIFDQVSCHLLTQNDRSIDSRTWSCAYHLPDGKKCAAGCLISDSEYSSHFEGSTWETLVEKYPDRIPTEHSELITALQHIHDKVAPPKWRDALSLLAKHRNLTFTR